MAEQIISVPSGEANRRPRVERRAWVRLPTSQAVSCQPLASPTAGETETAWLGRLLDVSPGGLALLLSRRFEAGTLLIIELSDQAKGRVRALGVRVVHATPEKESRWIIGCKFVSPLTEEELQTLVGG